MGSSQSKSPTKEVSEKERKVSTDSAKESAGAGDNVATLVTKASPVKAEVPVKPDLTVTEEEVLEVEAAAKKMRDTVGGTSIEIVLSPAVKKPKSRISPPTSPTSTEGTLAKKLQEAEERRQSLGQEKLSKVTAHLEKISLAQEKREKQEEKFTTEVLQKIESKQSHAEELRKKQMDEVKEKISEHSSKIEKAQKELEAAIEAAKADTQAAMEKRLNNYEENKNEKLEEMLTALKDHSERIKTVRDNMEEQMKPKAQYIIENIAKKEETAKELKAKQEQERKTKLEELEKRRELVRKNKEKLVSEQVLTPEEA